MMAMRQGLLLFLLGLLSLGLRLFYAAGITFPPPDDPAYYVTAARNLYLGRGFTSDVIWQYGGVLPKAPTINHPAGDFWPPLPSWLICGSFLVVGDSWPAAQLPGVLAGSGLSIVTYMVGRQIFVNNGRGLPLSAALLVAANGLLAYHSASADSAAPFSLLSALALWLASNLRGNALVVGALVGLACLARNEGILLYLAIALVNRTASRSLGLSGLVALAVVAPWLWRNYVTFGTPFPAPFLRLALLTEYTDLFNYVTPVNWERWWGQGLPALLAVRAAALWHNWHGVLDFLFFPTALLPVAGLWLLRREKCLIPVIAFGALLFLTSGLVFPIATMAGTFYHAVGGLAPFLAVATIYALRQAIAFLARWRAWKRDLFWVIYAALLLIAVAQFVLTARITAQEHKRQQLVLTSVASWLSNHPTRAVIATQPYNLNYLTGLPSLMLPANEEPAILRDLAGRYGARYLAITQRLGRYPEILWDDKPQGFRPVYRTPEAEIYEIE